MLSMIISPAEGVSVNDLSAFLQDKTSIQVRQKFTEAVRKDIHGSSWVIEHEGVVYSLYVVSVRRDKSQSIQNLALYLDGGRLNPEMYENIEAFNHVLCGHYRAKVKFSSASKVIGWDAFGLVWCRKINAPISEEEFNEKYVDTLYEWEGY